MSAAGIPWRCVWVDDTTEEQCQRDALDTAMYADLCERHAAAVEAEQAVKDAEAALLDAAKRYCNHLTIGEVEGLDTLMNANLTLTQAEAALAALTTETTDNG